MCLRQVHLPARALILDPLFTSSRVTSRATWVLSKYLPKFRAFESETDLSIICGEATLAFRRWLVPCIAALPSFCVFELIEISSSRAYLSPLQAVSSRRCVLPLQGPEGRNRALLTPLGVKYFAKRSQFSTADGLTRRECHSFASHELFSISRISFSSNVHEYHRYAIYFVKTTYVVIFFKQHTSIPRTYIFFHLIYVKKWWNMIFIFISFKINFYNKYWLK